MDAWLRTNEAEEAVAALEVAARFLSETAQDPAAWRWAILGLHIAVQGFMVIALRDSAGLLPLRDEVAEQWLKAYRQGKDWPAERLDSFPNLYKKVKRAKFAEFLGAVQFKPTGSQGRSIKMLNRLRNKFIHFLPMSWSVELAGLPAMSRDVLDFVEFLSCAYRPLVWHNSEHPQRTRSALISARQAVAAADTSSPAAQ